MARRRQPTNQIPRKPKLQNISLHALPNSVGMSLRFDDGVTMTFTFPLNQAEALSKGWAEAVEKAREIKTQ